MSEDTKTHGCDDRSGIDPQNEPRRRAIKTIVGLIGTVTAYNVIPNKWTKPIIDQVFIPACAATSGLNIYDPCTVTLLSGNRSTSSVTIRVEANITPPIQGLAAQIIATPSGTGNPITLDTTTGSEGTFGADLTITGGPGITSVTVQTTVTGAVSSVFCSVDIPAQTQPPSPSTTPAP